MRENVKFARSAGCEHNRDTVSADP